MNRARRRALVAVGVTVVIVLVGGWALRLGPSRDGAGATSTGSSVIQQVPAKDRVLVDSFQGELLDGSQFSSDSSPGQVRLFNVWGSWCGPCRTEAPVLKRAAETYAGRVAFVGINVRDDRDSARAFERAYGIPYPSIASTDSGDAMLAFGASLSVAAVPATVIVDRQGRVAARIVGPATYVTLQTLLDDVLAEADPRTPPG